MWGARRVVAAGLVLTSCGPPEAESATTGGSTTVPTDSTSGAASTETGSTADPTASSTGAPTTGAGPVWAEWTKFPDREFRGQVFDGAWVASDPCVLKDGDLYRMFYTCVAGPTLGGLCEVTAPDGIAWAPVPSIVPGIDGVIATGRPDIGWDENIETCAVVREAGAVSLYYSGYPDLDEQQNRGPAALGHMVAADAVTFTREPDAPLLEATPGGRDGDDIFSASVLAAGDTLEVVYVGWCVDEYHDGMNCANGPAVQLLGATRDADGVWTKRAEPVFAPAADPAWLQHGVAEPDVVLGPDGQYYLFMTGGLGDDEPRVTGIAVGPSAFGPWELNPQPILIQGAAGEFDACGAFAPSVVIDGDAVRTWYLGIDDCGGTCPSCNYVECGCEGRFTIGYAEAPWPIHMP